MPLLGGSSNQEELCAQLACIGAIVICNVRFTAARVAIDCAV